MTEKRVKEILLLCNSINAVTGVCRLRGDLHIADILERAQGAISELIRVVQQSAKEV